ncbi:MAG: ComEC/Rec2 family competence protein [Microgenomates group bacterium]
MVIKLSFKKCLALLCLIGSLVWLAAFSFPDNRLHLVFCDVGQGDATLITQGFNQILIDGGPNDKVLTCLKNNLPFFDRTIEVVALTHPEADHLTGLLSVLEKYKVDWFVAGPEGNSSATFAELVKKLESFCKATPCRHGQGRLVNVYTGEEIKAGDIVLQTLWPEKEWIAENIRGETTEDGKQVSDCTEKESVSDLSFCSQSSVLSHLSSETGAILGAKTIDTHLNDYSLVFLLKYKRKKFLLMGDADSRVQDKFIENITDLPIDILKFPHHGSKTGMSKVFLEHIKPKEAVISVGKNSFGHPTAEALEMLKNAGVKIRRTDLEGEIHYEY